jgi:hypothetical protein
MDANEVPPHASDRPPPPDDRHHHASRKGARLRRRNDIATAMTDSDRRRTLRDIMQYVVERYEGIEQISEFSIDVFKGDDRAFEYTARKEAGAWTLAPAPAS